MAGQKSLISESWTEKNQLPSKWCCWKSSTAGLAMSSGWIMSALQSSCSLVNYLKDQESKAGHISTTKTNWKAAWNGVASAFWTHYMAAQVCHHWHALICIESASLEKEQWEEQLAANYHCHRATSAPCHDNGPPVSHLPLTLQIQTGAEEPLQSPLTGTQTKLSLNPRDIHHIL